MRVVNGVVARLSDFAITQDSPVSEIGERSNNEITISMPRRVAEKRQNNHQANQECSEADRCQHCNGSRPNRHGSGIDANRLDTDQNSCFRVDSAI